MFVSDRTFVGVVVSLSVQELVTVSEAEAVGVSVPVIVTLTVAVFSGEVVELTVPVIEAVGVSVPVLVTLTLIEFSGEVVELTVGVAVMVRLGVPKVLLWEKSSESVSEDEAVLVALFVTVKLRVPLLVKVLDAVFSSVGVSDIDLVDDTVVVVDRVSVNKRRERLNVAV